MTWVLGGGQSPETQKWDLVDMGAGTGPWKDCEVRESLKRYLIAGLGQDYARLYPATHCPPAARL